ncbi:MAG: cell wall hydrolase [Rhodospirillales bacterium]
MVVLALCLLGVVIWDMVPAKGFGRLVQSGPLSISAIRDLPAMRAEELKRQAAIDPLKGPWGSEVVNFPAVDRDRPLYCLALNIYWEARSEPLDGQIAVAAVTLNRTKSEAFPDTICGVVQQGFSGRLHRCQFSWWCDGKSDVPEEIEAWNRSVELAAAVLDGKKQDPTEGAMWYHADYVSPDWAKHKVQVAKIGHHLFYRAKVRRDPSQVAMN